MKKLLYLILKRDMIKKLKEKHGEQFIDDVMSTFGIPTNLLSNYYKNKDENECKL
jgi:hypothetical protein